MLYNYKKLLSAHIENHYYIYSEECRAYVLNHFLEDSVVSLMGRDHINYRTDWKMADLVSECCQLLMQVAVSLIADDHPVALTIVFYCMDGSQPFFRHFGHDWL